MPSMAEAGDLPSHGGADPSRVRTSPPSPRRFPAFPGSHRTAGSARIPRASGLPGRSADLRPENRKPADRSPPFAGRSASMGPACFRADGRRNPAFAVPHDGLPGNRRRQPLFCVARLNYPASQKCVFAASSRNPLVSGYPLFDLPFGRRGSSEAPPSRSSSARSRMPVRPGGRERPAAWLRSGAASADTLSVSGGGAASPRNEGAAGGPSEGADRNFSSRLDNVEWEGLASPRCCDRSKAFPLPSRAAAPPMGSRRIAKRAM